MGGSRTWVACVFLAWQDLPESSLSQNSLVVRCEKANFLFFGVQSVMALEGKAKEESWSCCDTGSLNPVSLWLQTEDAFWE